MRIRNVAIAASLLLAALTNCLQADTIVRGSVSGTWDVNGSPYRAESTIFVPDGESLRIEPGVEVLFTPDNGMRVYGMLEALGSADDSIQFRSADDDTWKGIRFIHPDSLSRMEFCVIEHGMASFNQQQQDTVNSGGNIFLWEGDLVVRNSRISNGLASGFGGGIGIWGGHFLLEESVVNMNNSHTQGGGIHFSRGCQTTLNECILADNSAGWGGGGINIEEGSRIVVDRCTFETNNALTGGGLSLYGGHLEVLHTIIRENSGDMGGGAYVRHEGNSALFEWCDFIQNTAVRGQGLGGGMISRFGIDLEVSYCRFIKNHVSMIGGAMYFQGEQNADIHNNLLYQNWADGAAGAIGASENIGEQPLEILHCTLIGNYSTRGDEANSILIGPNSYMEISSSIVWEELPNFWHPDRIDIVYSHVKYGYEGIGNSEENPGIFELDSTWCLIRGDSPCVDSGEPDLNEDPDGSRNDRGWLYFPHDALDGLPSDTLMVYAEVGQRPAALLHYANPCAVPVYVSPMDMWREGERDIMLNVTGLTGDEQIRCAVWTTEGFLVAGGNNRRDPNNLYYIDRNFNLRRQINQPGGVNGNGFLDMATDGENVVFAGDHEQIVEFAVDGELGDQFEPFGVIVYNGVAVDFNYAHNRHDFYLGGNEGYIIRTDEDFWEQDRIQVGDTIRGLSAKCNSRALYMVTQPSPEAVILSLVDPDEESITPLYMLRRPAESARIGGIDVTHQWNEGRGSLVGVWMTDESDWLFVQDLYNIWLVIFPKWELVMPGEETEWEIIFAADQVQEGYHRSSFCMSVNGYGEEGVITAILRALPANIDDAVPSTLPIEYRIMSLHPNPFNSAINLEYRCPAAGQVRMIVFDQLGRDIYMQPLIVSSPGVFNYTWNAAGYPAGIYFIGIGNETWGTDWRKVALIK